MKREDSIKEKLRVIENHKDAIQKEKNDAYFLFKEWLLEIQRDHKIKVSLSQVAVGSYAYNTNWEIKPENAEIRTKLAQMETLADKFGFDLKQMCKSLIRENYPQ